MMCANKLTIKKTQKIYSVKSNNHRYSAWLLKLNSFNRNKLLISRDIDNNLFGKLRLQQV